MFVILTRSPSIPILCRDGIKLSGDDEKFIVENILMYHPEKEKKMAGNNNYIMVSSIPFSLPMHHKNQNPKLKLDEISSPACRLLSIKSSIAPGACTSHPQMALLQISPTRSA